MIFLLLGGYRGLYGGAGVWYGEKADLNPDAVAVWAGGGVWAYVVESWD